MMTLRSTSCTFTAVALAGIVASCCLREVSAKIVKGSASGETFLYLTDFCFADGGKNNKDPVGSVHIEVDTPQPNLFVYMFNDSKDSFPAAKDKGCNQATSPQGDDGQPYYADATNIGKKSPYSRDFFGVDGPRFWYFLSAVKHCNENVKIDSMKIHLKNGKSELSYDEFGIPGAMAFFGVVWILGLIVYIWKHMQTSTTDRLFVRGFIGCFSVRTVGLIFLSAYWLDYKATGLQVGVVEDIGRLFYIFSHIMMWTTALTMSEGIFSRVKDMTFRDYDASALALLLGCVIVLLYLSLAVWFEFGHAPYSTRYVYDTGIGIAISVIVALLGAVFLYRLRKLFVSKTFNQKRKDYLKLLAVLMPPCFLIPIADMIVGGTSPAWRRKNTVAVFDLLFVTITGTLIVFITWPSHEIFEEDNDNGVEDNDQWQEATQRLVENDEIDHDNLDEEEDGDAVFKANEAIGDEQL
eukprot:gb/GECG01002140.1/.p1 GENE.gb/GECG01002140.1/~~gb/GECG01002140.1/.p1  ORF type:complete len:466 (+),score=55.00 gb/GECG01002140.1/:1-1398(+)